MFVCMLIEWYVLAEILAFETYPVSEPDWKNLWHEDKNTHARAREREGETRYVAGTHCPRNQLDGMARSPSMDPQIWSASSKSLPFLDSTQSNTVRGGNFPVRFGTIDSLNFVLCFFCCCCFLCTGWCFSACNCRWPWSIGQDTDAIFWKEQEPCRKGRFYR